MDVPVRLNKSAVYTSQGRGYKTVLSTPCSNSMLNPRFHTVLNAQRRSPNFLSTVSYSDLSTERPNPEYAQDRAQRRTQTNKDGSSRRNWSISLSKFDFSVRVDYEVLSIHLKKWCIHNDLTGTVLCLKRRCLLNICKLKRQTTTVRYSVAIIIFWWQFFDDGTIRLLLGDTRSRPIARRNFSKTVCCRWTSNEVESWTFSHMMGRMYYSDLLEINKNNMNEGKF